MSRSTVIWRRFPRSGRVAEEIRPGTSNWSGFCPACRLKAWRKLVIRSPVRSYSSVAISQLDSAPWSRAPAGTLDRTWALRLHVRGSSRLRLPGQCARPPGTGPPGDEHEGPGGALMNARAPSQGPQPGPGRVRTCGGSTAGSAPSGMVQVSFSDSSVSGASAMLPNEAIHPFALGLAWWRRRLSPWAGGRRVAARLPVTTIDGNNNLCLNWLPWL
jgi:hypothetical protein